jgi:hypothetical protein
MFIAIGSISGALVAAASQEFMHSPIRCFSIYLLLQVISLLLVYDVSTDFEPENVSLSQG